MSQCYWYLFSFRMVYLDPKLFFVQLIFPSFQKQISCEMMHIYCSRYICVCLNICGCYRPMLTMLGFCCMVYNDPKHSILSFKSKFLGEMCIFCSYFIFYLVWISFFGCETILMTVFCSMIHNCPKYFINDTKYFVFSWFIHIFWKQISCGMVHTHSCLICELAWTFRGCYESMPWIPIFCSMVCKYLNIALMTLNILCSADLKMFF